MENLYKLDGKVPILKAINIAFCNKNAISVCFKLDARPIKEIGERLATNIAKICFNPKRIAFKIGTLIQLYPIWKIGSRLPIVMSVSFNFVAILTYVGATYGYASAMDAVLIGGLIEGCLGLLARY